MSSDILAAPLDDWYFDAWLADHRQLHPGGRLRCLGEAIVECADRSTRSIRVDDTERKMRLMRRSGLLYPSALFNLCGHLTDDGLLIEAALPGVWFLNLLSEKR